MGTRHRFDRWVPFEEAGRERAARRLPGRGTRRLTTFVDTSALFALLDEDDANHAAAAAQLQALRGQPLATHAYVVVETLALVGRRLPWKATERVMDVFLPLIEVHPVDQALHRAASLAYRAAGWADVSFVDRTSFTFMRDRAIEHAFAFDDDFVRNGFRANEQPAADPSDLGR